MDPNCAICDAPPQSQCPCEAERLQLAVQQSESRTLNPMLIEIQKWVIAHARDHVLQSFNSLSSNRQAQHAAHIAALQRDAAYYYNRPVNPIDIQNADFELKRGIDEDWRTSVRRYPEVLDYFYNLVKMSLPSDQSPKVLDPQIGGPGEPPRNGTADGMKRRPAAARLGSVGPGNDAPPPFDRRRREPAPPPPQANRVPVMPGVSHLPAPSAYAGGYGW
ncbi:MAG: hypothetical protein M1829_005686 [Trizodia sp. TS-e1964]|nr:MAG: hypothetical protein M1829_005686 [Trizodia sp. TS-e1964]